MDPLACFERLIDALIDGDKDEAEAAARDLAEWINGGGYTPYVLSYVQAKLR